MIFEQSQIPQTINLPFNWAADYFDGSYITEYDLKTHKPNSFYSIRQNNVIRFGLFGNGIKMYFDATDGHFYLKNRRLDIVYIDDNKGIFNLTNNTNKKDLITYKQAYTDFNEESIVQQTNVESVNFGYKTELSKHGINLFFQPIVSLPFGNSAFIEIKLTSSHNLNGDLVFYVSGREREKFHAPLDKNISGQLNWTIK